MAARVLNSVPVHVATSLQTRSPERVVQHGMLVPIASRHSSSLTTHSQANRHVLAATAAGLCVALALRHQAHRKRPSSSRVLCKAAGTAEAQATDIAETLRQLDERLEALIGAEVDAEPREEISRLEDQAQELLNGPLKGALPKFGSWQQLEKEELTLAALSSKGIDAGRLLSPQDSTQESIRKTFLAFVTAIGVYLILVVRMPIFEFFRLVLALGLFVGVDKIINRGLWENLFVDSIAQAIDAEYKSRISKHEAGHFLVAYLNGIMPRGYALSSWEAVSKYKSPNIQAGTIFLDSDMQKEVASGKLTTSSLDKFTFIALGGVATEYVIFGSAKGGNADLAQVDNMLSAIGMDQRKGNAQVRWSLLNVVELLRANAETHAKLADAMSRGASVGECISVIEGHAPPKPVTA